MLCLEHVLILHLQSLLSVAMHLTLMKRIGQLLSGFSDISKSLWIYSSSTKDHYHPWLVIQTLTGWVTETFEDPPLGLFSTWAVELLVDYLKGNLLLPFPYKKRSTWAKHKQQKKQFGFVIFLIN